MPAQVQRLARVGNPTSGPRRQFLPRAPEHPWGELTTRGADESRALGVRLHRWLQEREADMVGFEVSDEESEGTASGEEEEDSGGQGAMYPAGSIAVLAAPSRRAILSARALLDGLCSPGARMPVNTAAGAMWPADWAPHAAADAGSAECRLAALELRQALGLEHSAIDGGWPRLLDILESTSLSGLLPDGDIPEATRRAVLGAPRRVATALAGEASEAVCSLMRQSLLPSIRASRGASKERVRIAVMPGFSVLCLAAAYGLRGAMRWPAPASCLLLETLEDEANGIFLRFWQLRDSLELRPAWHRTGGPVPLPELLAAMKPFLASEAAAGERREKVAA